MIEKCACACDGVISFEQVGYVIIHRAITLVSIIQQIVKICIDCQADSSVINPQKNMNR